MPHTGGRRYGYRSRKDTDGTRLEIFEPEAAIVRRIFSNYRISRSWCPNTIRTILCNERYLGKIVWSRKHKVRDPRTGRRVFRSVYGAIAEHWKMDPSKLIPASSEPVHKRRNECDEKGFRALGRAWEYKCAHPEGQNGNAGSNHFATDAG